MFPGVVIVILNVLRISNNKNNYINTLKGNQQGILILNSA